MGPPDENGKLVEQEGGVGVGVTETGLLVHGDPIDAELAGRVFTQLYTLHEQGYPIYGSDVDYAIRTLSGDHSASLKDIFLDTVFISSHRRTITPKSVAQKAYIDAIRNHDVVFG